MTITHPLGADGLAILALTARSVGGRSGGIGPGAPKPLPPKDWARVARALAAAGASPADLLGATRGVRWSSTCPAAPRR